MAAVSATPSASFSSSQVSVDPPEVLTFAGDFRSVTTSKISLANAGSSRVIFKVKTTTPHRYLVRPNRGEIGARSKATVTVTLLPFHFIQGQRYNDKFLIQVCLDTKLNADYARHDYWSMVPRSELLSRKLRCVFRHRSALDDEAEDEEEVPPAAAPSPSPAVSARPRKGDSSWRVEGREEILRLRRQKRELEERNAELQEEIGALKRIRRRRAAEAAVLSVGDATSERPPLLLLVSLLVAAVAFLNVLSERLL